MTPDQPFITPDQLIEIIKVIGTAGATLLVAWMSQKVAQRNAKATEQTTALDIALQPLKESNAAWQALNAPLIARIEGLEKDNVADRARITRLEEEYGRALTLLLEWAAWITRGAPPPPPNIPAWLREHMPQALRDMLTTLSKEEEDDHPGTG
jgi:hypothetical protein